MAVTAVDGVGSSEEGRHGYYFIYCYWQRFLIIVRFRSFDFAEGDTGKRRIERKESERLGGNDGLLHEGLGDREGVDFINTCNKVLDHEKAGWVPVLFCETLW